MSKASDLKLIAEAYKIVREQTFSRATPGGGSESGYYNSSGQPVITQSKPGAAGQPSFGYFVDGSRQQPPAGGFKQDKDRFISDMNFRKYAAAFSSPTFSGSPWNQQYDPEEPINNPNFPHIKSMRNAIDYAASIGMTPEQFANYLRPWQRQMARKYGGQDSYQGQALQDVLTKMNTSPDINFEVKEYFDKMLQDLKARVKHK
jgi:hypothetical protein